MAHKTTWSYKPTKEELEILSRLSRVNAKMFGPVFAEIYHQLKIKGLARIQYKDGFPRAWLTVKGEKFLKGETA